MIKEFEYFSCVYRPCVYMYVFPGKMSGLGFPNIFIRSYDIPGQEIVTPSSPPHTRIIDEEVEVQWG